VASTAGVNFPRRRQSSGNHWDVVLASLDINDVGEHERAPFVFGEAAGRPGNQRHRLDVFVDLLVDFYEQPCFIERYNVVSQIPIVAH
jgi:hypothetical protein